jgi:hypothetical protein
MQNVKLELGQKCWVHGVDGSKKSECTVVHIFSRYGRDQYVLEYETHVDPVPMVRDGFSVSDAENLPIGLWRK